VKLFGGRLPRGPVLPAHGMSKSRPFGAALRGRPSGLPHLRMWLRLRKGTLRDAPLTRRLPSLKPP
jgi:hypothetical protein